MKLEQKLTVRSLGWTRGKIEEAIGKVPFEGGRILLGRVAGVAVGTKLARDMNDDTVTGLKGNFRGQSSLDGAMISSGVCFLPSGIQSMIESDLAEAKQHDPNATARFVIDLFAIPARNPTGYTYNADNILQDELADPVTELFVSAEKESPLNIPVAKKAIENKSEETPAEAEKEVAEPAKAAKK